MSWDEHAATWENESTKAYAESAFGSLQRLCNELGRPLDGARVCDFGCGTGLLAEKLAVHCSEVVAVDNSAAMIGVLAQKVADRPIRNLVPIAMTVDEAAIDGSVHLAEPFDLIVCSSVCAFLDDYPATVRLLASRLRAGGVFVQWDWERLPEAPEPFGLTKEQIRTALQDASLTVVKLETAFAISVGDHEMKPLLGAGQRGTDTRATEGRP